MPRPTLYTHRKFIRLSRAVGSKPLAIGLLTLIWEAGYQSGDPRVGSEEDVEALAEWAGPPGVLATALVDAGFLDRTADGLSIHDLHDHAPDYVRKRMDREASRKAKGIESISEARRLAARARWDKEQMQTDASVAVCNANAMQVDASGRTPTPAPAPTHKNGNGRFAPPSLEEIKAECSEKGFPLRLAEAFFDFYESNGWKVGRNPMKKWTSALRRWASTERERNTGGLSFPKDDIRTFTEEP